MTAHETSTDYANPHRPGPVRALNRVLGALPAAGPLSRALDADALMAEARQRTGLHHFGDMSFVEPLAVLLEAVRREARLHATGHLITRSRIVSTLSTRLRIEELYARNPNIERGRLVRPIVIVGLPRTGTTFLHRLLATDATRVRALMSWEALMPVSRPGADGGARALAAQRSEAALKYLAPDFFAVHPIDANGPEEDILLLDLAFRSTVPEATMNVPSYASWLEGVDQSPAYRGMARALKALQWQRAPLGESWRWVLKTPHHLEWLDELPKVLEDPLIVWTHRAPTEVVGSFCSMIAHGRGVFSDHVDPHDIGRSWLRKGKRMVERAMEARTRLGDANVLDVKYKDLIKDPMSVVKTIEERAGLGWDRDVADRIKGALTTEKKDRHGVHRYSLEAFGLSEATVNDAFGAYRAASGV